MSYPLIIKDNFFLDPDAIVKLSKKANYCSSSEMYPGIRSECFSEVNNKLFLFIGDKIFSLIHDDPPKYYRMKIAFQKIHPFVQNDKWNKKNIGWIHKDGCVFGGVIYLDKNPDKDAGTGIFKSKYGFDTQTIESEFIRRGLYSGKKIDDSLLRPTDEPIILGNINKAKDLLGWTQEISLEQTITDTLDYWRTL